jgi:hypothetical protein
LPNSSAIEFQVGGSKGHAATYIGIGALEDVNDVKGQFHLSPFQTVLDAEEGAVNLVICHYPPDRFM